MGLRKSFVSLCSLTITVREPVECGEGQSKKSGKGGACKGVCLGATGKEETFPSEGELGQAAPECVLLKTFIKVLICQTQYCLFSKFSVSPYFKPVKELLSSFH